jgi:hypothetical protein
MDKWDLDIFKNVHFRKMQSKTSKKSEKMTSDHNALILKIHNSKVLLKKKNKFKK